MKTEKDFIRKMVVVRMGETVARGGGRGAWSGNRKREKAHTFTSWTHLSSSLSLFFKP